MDISEQAGIFHFLKSKGYSLQESTPSRLRFEKQDESGSEIIVVNKPKSLPVQIKIKEDTFNYTAEDYDDLMDYLKKTIE